MNTSDVPEGTKGYNTVKPNMGGKTSVIRDDSKELDITIPKKLEKNNGMKLRNRNRINYNKLAHPKAKKLIQLPKKP